MPRSSCNLYNPRGEVLHKIRLAGNSSLLSLPLLRVIVVLAPLEHSALRGQAKCVVSATGHLANRVSELHQLGFGYTLVGNVKSKLSKGVVAPGVDRTLRVSCQHDRHRFSQVRWLA